jgi:thermitase
MPLASLYLNNLRFIIMPILHLRYVFLSACLAFGMASCSRMQTNSPDAPAKYALTLKVTRNDSASTIAQHYAGKMVAWYPEDGFAILGINEIPSQDERWISLEENQDDMNNPEVLPNSDSALPVPASVSSEGLYWSSGWSAWNSGSSVWAGGIKIWVTGDGVLPTRDQNNAVWDAIKLSNAWQNASKLGQGSKVAVIDTGIDTTHPIFQGRLAPENEWYDFVSNDNQPQEEGVAFDAAFGHGTGIAGLIAQVAPKAQILPLRVLRSNGQGDELDLVAALAWAISKNVNVINLSLGSNQASPAIELMLKTAGRLGIAVVASVGNNNLSKTNFPASLAKTNSNILAVASSKFRKELLGTSYSRSWYSNYGADVSVVAPGENLFTAFPGNAGKVWNGTSFSTALIGGSMALRMAQRPLSGSVASLVKSSSVGLLGTPDLSTQLNFLCSCGEIDVGRLQTR